jgi:hypothetical protein
MLPGARGAGTAARGNDAFKAPPGAGPRRVRAQEVPSAARFAMPRIGAPRRKGPPVMGTHRAGTFSLFLLPGGRLRRFAPELVPAAAEEAEGSIGSGVIEEEVALEEEGEVPEVSRRPYLGVWLASLRQISAREPKRWRSALQRSDAPS